MCEEHALGGKYETVHSCVKVVLEAANTKKRSHKKKSKVKKSKVKKSKGKAKKVLKSKKGKDKSKPSKKKSRKHALSTTVGTQETPVLVTWMYLKLQKTYENQYEISILCAIFLADTPSTPLEHAYKRIKGNYWLHAS